jgi:N-acetylmuramoyl-L-alanine amidase
MPTHVVQQGEWIGSIAKTYGFYDWHRIYDHPQNADLKQQRPDAQLLYPNDQVFIPPLEPDLFSGATDQEHQFQLKTPTITLTIIVKDENDQPIASKPYKLTIDKKNYDGTTGADGKVEKEIPLDAQSGTLDVEGYHFDVRVSSMDPIDTIMGVQKRLTNLGYDCSPIDATMNDATTQSITQFQQEMNLQATGQLDDITKNKLKEKYGC